MASGFEYSKGSVAVDDAVGGNVRNTCVPCGRDQKTTTASLMCTACDERLCHDCSKHHKKYALGKHVFVDINNSDCVKTQVDIKGYDRCKDHSRVLVYVCQDHNKALCCDECLFASHRKCDRVEKIIQSTSSNGQQSALNDTEVRRIVAEAERLAIASEKKVKENEKLANELCAEIDNKKKCVMAMFDEAKTQIRRELSAGNASDKERLDKSRDIANSIKSDLEGFGAVFKQVKDHGNDNEKRIINAVSEIILTHSHIKLNEMKQTDYAISRSLEWDPQVISLFNMNSLKVALKVTRLPDPSQGVQASGRVVDTRSLVLKQEKMTVLKKEKGDTEYIWVTGLTFLPDGRIAAIDQGNNKCVILDAGLQRSGPPYWFKEKPRDVTCYGNTNLAVTLEYDMFFIYTVLYKIGRVKHLHISKRLQI